MRNPCPVYVRAILLSLLSSWIAFDAFAADVLGAQPPLPHAQVIIDTDNGPRRFTVELATSSAQQEAGLMFRKSLAPDAGMLFPFRKARKVFVWMKNTQIPLDLLFIRNDGMIALITANATPFSTEHINSGEAVRAVMEIPGERAAQLGIKTGDRVRHFANLAR
jgi:hypothetical protein